MLEAAWSKKKQLSTGLLLILILVVFLDICNFFMPVPVYTRLFIHGFFLAAPIIAVKEYHLTPDGIANHFLLFAIGSAFTTWLNTRISKRYQSTHIYLVALCVTIVGFLFVYSAVPILFWLAFLLFGLGGMLCWVHTNNLFSGLVGPTEQGLIMGVSQAMWSIGGLLSALMVGFLAAVHYQATGVTKK